MHERLSYRGVQKLLHWLIALAVIGQIALGLTIRGFKNVAAVEAELGPGSFNRLYDLHKEIGLLILALMILRLVARLGYGAPPYYPRIAPHEQVLSTIVHWALYGFLILVPILGWIAISAYPALPNWFGLFKVPGLVAPDKALFETVIGWHRPLAWLILALAALHVMAALFHGIVKRDGVLSRMAR